MGAQVASSDQHLFIMGNLCAQAKGMSASRPPRDLNALLSEIRCPSDVDSCGWARSFRHHLSKSGDADGEALFDFCIAANALRAKGESLRDPSTGRVVAASAAVRDVNAERAELLRAIHRSFFAEDAPRPIALSNAVLREELWRALEEADDDGAGDDDDAKVEAAYELVWQARCDYKVWKGGLHRKYNQFVASKPSPGIQAVIMSIL